MSSKRPHIDPAVIEVVRAWARASSLDDAARTLKKGRLNLEPTLRPSLQREIAEISAESFLEVLTQEDGVAEGETVELNGIPLQPKQLERVSAWRLDQEPTADALGVDLERWQTLVIAGMEAVCLALGGDVVAPAAASTSPPGQPMADKMAKARALLGQGPSTFEHRPSPATSEGAGLRGILAAKAFAKGARSKKSREPNDD